MRLQTCVHIFPAFVLCLLLADARAQNPLAHDPTAAETTTTDTQSPAPPMTPEQIVLITRYLTSVHAEIAGEIDTKDAASGQGITLKTTQDTTLANGTELPKGTRLTGHILRAHNYQPDGAAALLSISIDRALLKDGSSIPIRCVIRALATTASRSTGIADASQPGSRPRGSGGPSAGGPVGGTIPLGSSTPMGSAPISDSSTGDIGGAGTRPQLPNTTAIPATYDPGQPVASAGESIHDIPHRTGIPGVMLSGASVAGISGNLTAFEHNITLDSATQFTLGIISAK